MRVAIGCPNESVVSEPQPRGESRRRIVLTWRNELAAESDRLTTQLAIHGRTADLDEALRAWADEWRECGQLLGHLRGLSGTR